MRSGSCICCKPWATHGIYHAGMEDMSVREEVCNQVLMQCWQSQSYDACRYLHVPFQDNLLSAVCAVTINDCTQCLRWGVLFLIMQCKIWCMKLCMLARDCCCAGSKFEACRASGHWATRLTCTERDICVAGGKFVIYVQSTGEQASLSSQHQCSWCSGHHAWHASSCQRTDRLHCWRPDSPWSWCILKASCIRSGASSGYAHLQLCCSSAHHG